MPAFPSLTPADVASVSQYLDDLCTAYGVTGADLYAANCPSCHGADARGAFGYGEQLGPDIRCYDAADFAQVIPIGEDEMPPFPLLDPSRIDRITTWVRAKCGS
jgi:mono/diheme cytochrome c family protein